jgi:F0F1-type ATP synthase membrane subunit a
VNLRLVSNGLAGKFIFVLVLLKFPWPSSQNFWAICAPLAEALEHPNGIWKN